MSVSKEKKSVVFMGYSGAVGAEALKTLLREDRLSKLTLVGRKKVDVQSRLPIDQHQVDVLNSKTYSHLLAGHDTAICTLGVGQPSKMTRDEFLRIDKNAVIEFARSCKDAGVKHFELLGSVSASAKSKSFYLRTKGELVEELEKLNFERLSIFQPSMILTPQNRYGFSQAVTLKVWPHLDFALQGRLKKFRGVPVQILGEAIAKNVFTESRGFEVLHWDQFYSLVQT